MVHASYMSTVGSCYITNAGGTWIREVVDTGGVGKFTDIAIDAENKVHISYYDYFHEDLRYASNSGGMAELDRRQRR
jgi:hypothetical protein